MRKSKNYFSPQTFYSNITVMVCWINIGDFWPKFFFSQIRLFTHILRIHAYRRVSRCKMWDFGAKSHDRSNGVPLRYTHVLRYEAKSLCQGAESLCIVWLVRLPRASRSSTRTRINKYLRWLVSLFQNVGVMDKIDLSDIVRAKLINIGNFGNRLFEKRI